MLNCFNKIFKHSWTPYLVIIGITFFAYMQILFHDLTYSDDHVLIGNHYEFNKNLSNIDASFTEDIFKTPGDMGSYYRPILRLSFMLEAQLGAGSVVFIAHFSNIIFHILSICLLFLLLNKLGIKKEFAFIASLLFAIHPITTQTVSLIAGRNDSLLAIFFILSIIFFLKFIEKNTWKDYTLHLFFFLCALFTKETAIVLPIICITYYLLFKLDELKKMRNQHALLLLGWCGFGYLWFWLRSIALRHTIAGTEFNILESISVNAPSVVPAIGKIFLPFNLALFPVLEDMTMLYGVCSIIFLLLFFILAKEKNYKMIIFGLIWFFSLVIFTLIKPIGSIPEFSEHRTYLAMFGFVFIFYGLGKINWFKKEKFNQLWVILLLLVIFVFLILTMNRNQQYKDGMTFWKNAVRTSPSRAFNYNNLGAMYHISGNKEKAVEYYLQTLELNPREPLVNYNLGLIKEEEGYFEAAEIFYQKEVDLNPENQEFMQNILNRLNYKKNQPKK